MRLYDTIVESIADTLHKEGLQAATDRAARYERNAGLDADKLLKAARMYGSGFVVKGSPAEVVAEWNRLAREDERPS